ncbi:MAG TPA: hypothetical protein VK815_19000 [Candidatus Acidoferrales bacterium]|jgi:hypothetical protein|nr:hypothetical protein [Candidatus Acidoferrales bacterium]
MVVNKPFKPVKKTFTSFCLAVGMMLWAALQNLHAVPITGRLDFSGNAKLDGPNTGHSTGIVSWGANNVAGFANGSFAGLAGSAVDFAAPSWSFNSGLYNDFWSVGGFTFNLSYSAVFSTTATSLTVFFLGTVTSSDAGFEPTAFNGTFTIQDPAPGAGGMSAYQETLLFNGVPDGGGTILLAGMAVLALGLVKLRWRRAV